MKKKLLRDNKGFTLVELIVVLVILAILIALLVPALTGYIDKAKKKTKIAECRLAVEAAQTCLSELYGAAEGSQLTDLSIALNQGDTIQAILDLAEVPGKLRGDILIEESAVIYQLVYEAEDGTIVNYRTDHEPQYWIDDDGAGYSSDAPGYTRWAGDTDYGMEVFLDENGKLKEEFEQYFDGSTNDAKTAKMKQYATKRLQALFLEQNNGEYPKVDPSEIKLPDSLKHKDSLDNCVWKPMVTNDDKVFMVADTKGKNGSNAYGPVIYYDGSYYYHDNGYGNLSGATITDEKEKLDISNILTSTEKGKWVKI